MHKMRHAMRVSACQLKPGRPAVMKWPDTLNQETRGWALEVLSSRVPDQFKLDLKPRTWVSERGWTWT